MMRKLHLLFTAVLLLFVFNTNAADIDLRTRLSSVDIASAVFQVEDIDFGDLLNPSFVDVSSFGYVRPPF